MTDTPINLNKARKARAKVAAKQKAQENRALHSRTRAEKTADRLAAEKARREIDAHKRED